MLDYAATLPPIRAAARDVDASVMKMLAFALLIPCRMMMPLRHYTMRRLRRAIARV